ncbi:hypothetical protein ACEOS4_004553 [Escherichia coli]|nr:hypothetical protein [Escherichia coli]MCM7418732.1 hypothetical protein [Enterobacter hormaechei]MDI0710301.1 hypothetical protein [Escherichia coli]HCO9425531.1 hypothetical protein [Escherichia coli]
MDDKISHLLGFEVNVSSINHIKNPLTIVGIFAGIVEISANLVLPFLDKENQVTYVWFLMLFPTILVIMFFATLNWNHGVLYAPSDYQNDDAFVQIHARQKMHFDNNLMEGNSEVFVTVEE